MNNKGRSTYADYGRVLLTEHAVLLLGDDAQAGGRRRRKLRILEQLEQAVDHRVTALIGPDHEGLRHL